MKENRDSIYVKKMTQDSKKDEPNSQEPDNSLEIQFLQKDFSAFQRTKDEDWEAIFILYGTYIDLIVK